MERMASDQLADHRSVWDRKPVLRLVYDDFYDRIAAACRGASPSRAAAASAT